jgi:hypothetical protein
VGWRHERVARRARDLTTAFLGPSYSDIGDLPPALNPADPVERAVLDEFDGQVLSVAVPAVHRERARIRLRTMTELLRDRPIRAARRWRAVGRILRDFELALDQRDARSSRDLLEELRGGGYLDALNLAYLDLRRLASIELWNEVLAHPDLGAALDVGLPRKVAEAIIRAIYRVRMSEFEAGARASDALSRFKDEVLPRYPTLFRTRRGMAGFETDASFMLFDLAAGIANPEAAAVVERYGSDPERHAFLGAIAAALPAARPEADKLDEAVRLFSEGLVDAAFSAAVAAERGVRRCQLLLRCALEIDTDGVLAEALAAVEDLPAHDRDALARSPGWKRRLQLAYERIGTRSSDTRATRSTAVDSWESWFDRLLEARPWPGAVASATEGSGRWGTEALASRPDAIERVCGILSATSHEWSAEAIRRAVPSLVRVFAAPATNSRLKPIAAVLFDLLATEQDPSVPMCAALVQLGHACLRDGERTARYSEILEGLASVLESVGTPAVVTIVLEALDVVLWVATPSEPVRRAFAARAASILARWWHRTDRADQVLALGLLGDLGVGDTLPPVRPTETSGGIDPWQGLAHRSVAIYSLNSSAAHRVAAVLGRLCPDVRVSVFSDLVGGSAALREKARSADLFVIVKGAAKHAATEYIEAQRPREAATVYPVGQGSSSILAAIRVSLSST